MSFDWLEEGNGAANADVVSVLMPSFNTRDLTLETLRTVIRHAGCPIEVVVVDNASTDGSASAVRAMFPEARVLENHSNRGFAGAINQGAALARGKYHLWLNSDAFVPDAGVRHLREQAEAVDRAACVGPQLVFEDGSPQMSTGGLPSWGQNLRLLLNALLRRGQTPHQWLLEDPVIDGGCFVSGTCLLVDATAWQQVGPLDERFFFYFEEADWQHRARQLGWQLCVAPDVKVTHLRGASGAETRAVLSLSAEHGADLFVLEHEGAMGLTLRRILGLPFLIVAAVRVGLFQRGTKFDQRAVVKAILWGRCRQLVRNPRSVSRSPRVRI